jgi:hypothetical protein
MTSKNSILAVGAVSMLLFSGRIAQAAVPWVDRTITLPRHDWAFDFGFGIAHVPNPNNAFGPGFNIEGAGAVTRAVQLGLRTGLRFGVPARSNGPAGADAYGRPFDTETYGQGNDVVANPEFYVRGALVQGDVFELGLEGRIYTPFSVGLGVMFGMPLAFHLGRVARIDTGVYIPVFFYDPTRAIISLPFHLWFQLTDKLWLGPLLGLRFYSNNPDGACGAPGFWPGCGNRASVPFGFGLGYQISRELDFKTQMIFQDVANGGNPYWGLGAGIQVRIE